MRDQPGIERAEPDAELPIRLIDLRPETLAAQPPPVSFASPPPPYSIPPRTPRLEFSPAPVAIGPPALGAARRTARDLGVMLILAAVLVAADAIATLVWQEPVTAVIALVQHRTIDRRAIAAPLSQLDRHALAGLTSTSQRVAFLARRERARLTPGAAVGTIKIPKIGVSFEIVQGTDAASLERGPGHYGSSPLPGLGGTVAIAGHRTTYLAPFRKLNALHAGDRITLRMPYGTFVYVVQRQQIVAPTATWVLRGAGYERLVLTACNPLYSAAQRIAVFARLQELRPRGAARS